MLPRNASAKAPATHHHTSPVTQAKTPFGRMPSPIALTQAKLATSACGTERDTAKMCGR